MKKSILVSYLIVILIIVPVLNKTFCQQISEKIFAPGEVIVKFSTAIDFRRYDTNIPLMTGIKPIDAIDKIHPLLRTTLVFPGIKSSLAKEVVLPTGKTALVPDLTNIYRLQFTADLDVLALIHELKKDPQVLFSEPNYIARVSALPDDPLLLNQWGLFTIKADSAWSIETGDADVIIGVLDTGIDINHEDLSGNIWFNQSETPDNDIDDDDNGYIDDVYGWNFVSNTKNTADNAGHGTHVAGIASAASNNALGGSGVSWNSKLMAVTVLNNNGEGLYSGIAEGITYAAQNGAKIINMSLGGYYPSQLLETALLNAYATSLLTAAAGNDSRSDPYYPAAYPYVLGVAGTDSNDVRWSDSNYGSWISMTAPADGIVSTKLSNTYGALSGTSMAAAFVSGTAALLFSQDPALEPATIFNQLLNSSDNIDSLNSSYAGLLGSGRLNAYHALSRLPVPLLVINKTVVDDQSGGDGDGVLDAGETANLRIELYNTGKSVSDINATLLTSDVMIQISEDESEYANITARDSVSNQTPFSVAVSADVPNDHEVPFKLKVESSEGFLDTLEFNLITQREFNLSGIIASNTTLTRDKLYVVTGNLLISEGVTLTIEPGVVLRFNSGRCMQVNGKLVARGTSQDTIFFTSNRSSPRPGDWGNVAFSDASSDAVYDSSGNYLDGSVLEYVKVEYGGGIGSTGMIDVDYSSPCITNSVIQNSSLGGIYVQWGKPRIQNNLISNNQNIGIYINCTNVFHNHVVDILNNNIRNNFGNGIHLNNASGSIINNTIENNKGDGIWWFYIFYNELICAGNIIKDNLGWGFSTDTQGNYSGSCRVENNLITANQGGGIKTNYFIYDPLFITNNVISNNTGYALYTDNSNQDITNNLICGNVSDKDALIYLKPGISHEINIHKNTIVHNKLTSTYTSSAIVSLDGSEQIITIEQNNFYKNRAPYTIYNYIPGSATIPAQNNWWGTTDEQQIQEQIYDWLDDGSLGYLNYLPFLTSPDANAPGYLHQLTTDPPSPVSIEPVEFTLHFSSPMDIATTPAIMVIDSINTRYPVNVNAEWIDSLTYKASITITEMFYNDAYLIEVSGAKDKDGFDMPPDTTNRLIVYTAGSAARELRSVSLGDKVRLSWNPAGITNLLGYNLYRSQTSHQDYQRISKSIIIDTTYVDSIFIDSGTYYYVYTIVDGTFKESGYSNEVSVSVTSINSHEMQMPAAYTLWQNYPNPLNPKTVISYQVGANGNSPVHVELDIYNPLGQKLSTLVSANQPAGYYKVEWNASGFPSGVYFYRLTTDQGFVQTRKLVIIK